MINRLADEYLNIEDLNSAFVISFDIFKLFSSDCCRVRLTMNVCVDWMQKNTIKGCGKIAFDINSV
jgi:hypothetical protein